MMIIPLKHLDNSFRFSILGEKESNGREDVNVTCIGTATLNTLPDQDESVTLISRTIPSEMGLLRFYYKERIPFSVAQENICGYRFSCHDSSEISIHVIVEPCKLSKSMSNAFFNAIECHLAKTIHELTDMPCLHSCIDIQESHTEDHRGYLKILKERQLKFHQNQCQFQIQDFSQDIQVYSRKLIAGISSLIQDIINYVF